MEKVRVEDAVGMILAHDLTKIVPGSYKGAAFKKGHVIQAEDIEELKNMGKNHIYIVPLTDSQVHENDGAYQIARNAALGMTVSEPLEGKSNIRAKERGVLRINREALLELNELGEIALVTLPDHSVVEKDLVVAAAKIIPLVVEKEKLLRAEVICRQNYPVVQVKPIYPLKTAVIVTGSEVFYGRIQDRFGKVLQDKILHYGGEFLDLQYAPDDLDQIYALIMDAERKGAEIILISGGMAVDADDVTPGAIRKAATEIVSYGVPVLPGAMCMLAYRQEIAIMGVPACAMFNATTILDIIFPRLLAKEHIQKKELISLAHGGMCLGCQECHYPACSFGKS